MQRREILKFSAATILAMAAVGSTSTEAFAQDWPSQTITFVVPFSPGGSNDVIARFLAQELTESLGQPVVIENRAGGGGSIGAAHVATSSPDGYTFLFTSATIATNAAFQSVPFDLSTDFAPVSRVGTSPYIIVSRDGLGATDIMEFADIARAAPGELSYGTAGVGDSAHFLTELFSRAAGIQMEMIPYPGAADAQVDLAAGRVDVVFTTIATLAGSVAENLPRLAFTSPARVPSHPDIPTVQESGIDFSFEHWWGVLAPAGTDPNTVNAMNAAIVDAIEAERFGNFLSGIGGQVAPSSPEQLTDILLAEYAQWQVIVEELGIGN